MNDAAVLICFATLAGSGARENSSEAFGIRTEQAYLDWIKRFICHSGKRPPNERARMRRGVF
ncbi:MAG: hypothetical protein PHG47_03945 [Sulfuricella sp.]|nr:hypothetical protein [Sulfuricella sp.]